MFQENCTISSEDKSYSLCKLELWLYISNTTKPVSNSEDEIKYLWKPIVQYKTPQFGFTAKLHLRHFTLQLANRNHLHG